MPDTKKGAVHAPFFKSCVRGFRRGLLSGRFVFHPHRAGAHALRRTRQMPHRLQMQIDQFQIVGLRKLADAEAVAKALTTLTGRARIKRTMWSRRAQEYEAKINSGDLVAIAEVVRDLYRSEAQPEQSYSERQLYEAALDRMVREIAVVDDITEIEALKKIEGQLAKSPRRTGKAEAAEAELEGDNDDLQEEAA